MPVTPKNVVFDTSALLCLKQDEPGAEEVARMLREAGAKNRAFVSFISLMEFYYILEQSHGEAHARRDYLELKMLPLRVVESDEELGLAAARIKAQAKLSVADAWIAATAERLQATLIHKDPEFDQLRDQISLHALPYKHS